MRTRSVWGIVAGVAAIAQIAGAQNIRPRAPVLGHAPPIPGPQRPAAPGRPFGRLPGIALLDPYLLPGYAYDASVYEYESPYDYSYGAPATYAAPYVFAPPTYGPVLEVSYGSPAYSTNAGLTTAAYSYSYADGGLTVIGSGRAPITALPGGALDVTLGTGNVEVVQPCAPVGSGSKTGLNVMPLAAPVRPAADSAGHLTPYVFAGPPSASAPAAVALIGGACWGVNDGGLAVIVWG